MHENPPRTEEPLADAQIVYRAFAAEGFRKRPKKVRAKAYFRPADHVDGISLGLTPDDAVSGLQTNFGYCSVKVGAIRQLGYGLDVRRDPKDPSHILLCNVPFLIGEDQDRGMAYEIASALAKISTVESCDLYPPKKSGEPPPV